MATAVVCKPIRVRRRMYACMVATSKLKAMGIVKFQILRDIDGKPNLKRKSKGVLNYGRFYGMH